MTPADAMTGIAATHDRVMHDGVRAHVLTFVLLFVAAIASRAMLAANTDVSWLLTVGERVLDGDRLYIDIVETNPPMAVWAYLLGIALARVLGLRPEIVTDILVFVSIGASLGISAWMMRRIADLRDGAALALMAFAILAVLPAQTFGQREHIALIAMLPALAVLIARRSGASLPLVGALVAGAGLAIALAFKPQFVLGWACATGAAFVFRRSWRLICTPENAVAAFLLALYLIAIVVLHPAYITTIVPMLRDVYVPVGLPLAELLAKPALPIWAIAAVTGLVLARGGSARVLVPLAASAGFAIVFVLQRKGWPYHSYPMLALVLFALGAAVIERAPFKPERLRAAAAAVLGVALFARALMWFDVAFDASPLQAAVARVAPHPALLAITAEPGIGHPLIRVLGGTWVSRQQGLWVAAYQRYLRRADDEYAARERADLIADIRRRPPDVVLIDDLTGDWSAWLAAHGDVAATLAGYRVVGTLNRVTILAR